MSQMNGKLQISASFQTVAGDSMRGNKLLVMNDHGICFHTTDDMLEAEKRALNLRNSGYHTHIKTKKYKFYGQTVTRYEVYASMQHFLSYKSKAARRAEKEAGQSVFEMDSE